MTSPRTPSIDDVAEAIRITHTQGQDPDRWGLSFGSVQDPNNADIPNVILDGDTALIPAISLIGVNLATGARVSVLSIPPSGNYIIAEQMTRAVNVFSSVVFTTTSTSYTAVGAVFCGVAFVAPPSGRVTIHWSAEVQGSTTATVCLVSPQVATGSVVGSGSVVTGWAANDNRQVRADVTTPVRTADMDIVDGLVPRQIYNVALYHRVVSGTGTIGRRRIVVSPVG